MTMKVLRKPTTMALMLTFLAWFGCAGKINTTKFTNPQFDFGFVDKIAVLPLENLSSDNQAGERATRILITELLASGAVDVVEPGEVRAALGRVPGTLGKRHYSGCHTRFAHDGDRDRSPGLGCDTN
jgi:hypothetical protein